MLGWVDAVSVCSPWVWTYWYKVSGTSLSSLPSSIFTSASSIFATFLKNIRRIYAATVHLHSSSFSIPHPFTPESEPGLKYTEDMMRLPSSSLRSELEISVFREQNEQHCSKKRTDRSGKIRFNFLLSAHCQICRKRSEQNPTDGQYVFERIGDNPLFSSGRPLN